MGSSPINATTIAAVVSLGENFLHVTTTSSSYIHMDENYPLFQLMKLVYISTNETHLRIKPLPINRLRET